MKRKYNNIIALVIVVSLVLSAAFMTGCSKTPKKNVIKLGLCLYRFDDTFISNVRQEIEEYVKEYEKEQGQSKYAKSSGGEICLTQL